MLKSGRKREGLRGKKRKGLIGACLFYACKQNNEPRTKQEIAQILDIPKTYITKGCKIFLDLMKDDSNNEIFYTCDPEENGEHFYVGFLTKSRNPHGQCMPCCFKKPQLDTTNKKNNIQHPSI